MENLYDIRIMYDELLEVHRWRNASFEPPPMSDSPLFWEINKKTNDIIRYSCDVLVRGLEDVVYIACMDENGKWSCDDYCEPLFWKYIE
jgi:hypothetical protein